MSEFTSTLTNNSIKKIKAINPQIIISDSQNKRYYEISYFDTEKQEYFIGYGSYDLKQVVRWFKDCFERVEGRLREVVYCEECSHCDPENHHCDHPMGTSLPVPRKSDDFCSYGERKITL